MKHSSIQWMRAALAILVFTVLVSAGFFYYPHITTSIGAADMPRPGSGSMKSWFITYKRPMAPPGMFSQIITQTQGCLLTITGPIMDVDLPDTAEIGKYQRPCDAQEAEPLKALADAAIAEAASIKDLDVPRGTRFLTFGIGETGGELEKLASYPMSMPFPAAIQKFDEAMIAAARKTREKPLATLKGTAKLAFAELAPKQDFELSLVLQNSGTAKILIHNPAAAEEDEKIGLEVAFAKNLPAESSEDDDIEFVRLKKGEVTQLRALGAEPLKKSEPLVRLGPGQEIILSLKIKRHAYFRPGSYKAWVTYESFTNSVPEEESVQGSLSIPAGAFAVKGKP
jgi:hypothetical protein